MWPCRLLIESSIGLSDCHCGQSYKATLSWLWLPVRCYHLLHNERHQTGPDAAYTSSDDVEMHYCEAQAILHICMTQDI
jgi:hypothetical protein